MLRLFRTLAAAATLAFGAAGCNLSDQEVLALTGSAVAVASVADTSPQRQRQLANAATNEYLRTYGRSSDRALENKLQQMTQRIAQANNLGPQWRVYLIPNDQPNAATPGAGDIYVHTGLLQMTDSEAQMAMVLAHEMAHVTLEHGVKQRRDLTLGAAAAAVVGSRVSDPAQQLALQLGTGAAMSGYSRSAEQEADAVGFRYFVRAGYEPREAAKVFRNFQRAFGEADAVSHFFSGTHPKSSVRAQRMDQMAASLSNSGSLVTTREFERLAAPYR